MNGQEKIDGRIPFTIPGILFIRSDSKTIGQFTMKGGRYNA
jgi:hypothetical protein